MLKSNFIKPKLSIDFFGKTRFWIGLFLGLGFAFSLFAFFSFFKLALHHITYMDWVGYSITPPKETLFYQFIFAFVALLMGQHFFFEFTLFKAKQFRGEKFRKNTIVHNSRFCSWTTLFVGFKWIVSIGLLSFVQLTPLFGYFTFGWWASIFLIVWWHFFIWQEVSKIFKNGRWWSLISFLGIGFLSFISIQIFPNIYSNVYRERVEKLAHFQLKIDLPVAIKDVSSKLIHQSLIQTFFAGDPEENDTIRISTPWNKEIKANSIPLLIENFNQKIPESKRGLIVALVAIDKEIKMKHVYKLLHVLGKNNRLKISFAALTEDQNNPKVYYGYFNKGLLTANPPHCTNLKPAVEMIEGNPNITTEYLENFYAKTELPYCEFYFPFSSELFNQGLDYIKISAQNEFSFNDKKIAREELFEKIKNTIWEKKEKVIFVFDVDDKATYEHYFFLRQEHKRAFNESRNQEALISLGKEYDFLDRTQQREIRYKYPMYIEEFFSVEERFIFDFFRNKSSIN